MDVFVKEATEHKCEKQELLNKMEMLNQKISEFDQLRLLKENLDTYVSLQTEADNIKNIPPNIVGNAINNNLEEIEYAEQEELGTAATNADNSSVENHHRNLQLQADSPVWTLPKSGVRNNMDSNFTILEETILLVSLKLEESQESFQIPQDDTNKLTKHVEQLEKELSQLKGKFEEIKVKNRSKSRAWLGRSRT